jgi:hypothetical protein
VYAIKDFAALKFWYLTDRDHPVAMAVYFAADMAFPKLKGDNLSERLAWDRERFQRLAKFLAARQAAKKLEALDQAAEGPEVIAPGEWPKPGTNAVGVCAARAPGALREATA